MDIFNMINWNALSALATAASAIVTAIVQAKNIRIIVAEDFIQKLRKNKSFFIHEDLKLISEGSCHVFNYLQPFGRLKICISDVHGWNIIHILSDSLIKIKCSYNDYEEETELLVKQTIRL